MAFHGNDWILAIRQNYLKLSGCTFSGIPQGIAKFRKRAAEFSFFPGSVIFAPFPLIQSPFFG